MLQRKMDGKEFRMDVIFQKITHLKGVKNMKMVNVMQNKINLCSDF